MNAADPNPVLPRGVCKNWFAEAKRKIEASEYEIRWQPQADAYQSPNRSQNMRFTYLAKGFRVEPRNVGEQEADWRAELRLTTLKRGDAVQAFEGGELKVSANTAETQGGLCQIKYKNGPEGMRQDFVVEKKLEGSGNLELVFSADLKGLQLAVADGGDAVSFTRDAPGGTEVLRYKDLKVFDANQQPLVAHMVRHSTDTFSIVVNDAGAEYPILIDPLSTSANWNAEANQASAAFGWSVATAGDVNGDGYSDVIVGAPGYDNGSTDEGRIFVYHGSSGGLPGSANWTGESDVAGTEWGWAVSTAGDITGDGYSDIIIGCPKSGGYGKIHVWFGGASGLGNNGTPANADVTIDASTASVVHTHGAYQFGYSVSTAGDVNGDGYSDVIIGAPRLQNNAGDQYVYVYHGHGGGLGSEPATSLAFNQNYAMFGHSVACAGDVNGDGYSDVIIGAPYYDYGQTDEGLASFHPGSSVGVGTAARSWEGNQTGANFGFRVAGVGDVNGDGYSDVAVGAPYYDDGQTDEGAIFVYHGSSSNPPLPTSANWTAQSDQASAVFGYSIGLAGDINGDGFSDLIVGAPYYDNGQTDEGRAFAWYGGGSGLGSSGTPSNADWSAESDQASANLGVVAVTAGDVNGDGFSDVIIGASAYDNGQTDEGRAFVYHGSSAGLSTSSGWSAESDQSGASHGVSVASAGDVNGDGYSDVIVGAWGYDNGNVNEGRAYVYHGSASGLSSTADWTAEADQNDAGLGVSVASAGDVNGDGYGDIIVGANGYSNGQTVEGAAFVWLGSSTGLGSNGNPGNADWMAESDQIGYNNFGFSVASAGDVNGDGYGDIIIGAYDYTTDSDREGVVLVWHGSSTGLGSNGNPGNADWMAESEQSYSLFGVSVASAGDVNGDGYGDIIVGSAGYDGYGAAFVWHGSSTGLGASGTPSNANWKAEADSGSWFGYTLAGAGDVNGDGYSDIIIGAPLYGFYSVGRVFAYYGGSGGLGSNGTEANADWSIQASQNFGEFGTSVASAGDVNGDGYSDVIIGGEYYDNGALTNAGIALAYFGGSGGLAASADWTFLGDQSQGRLGHAVASAGDVNGDGYSDVLAGAHKYDNGQSDEGKVWLFYGNQGDGLDSKPRQWRTNLTTPVQPGLLTGSTTSAGLGLFARSFYGRMDVKMQYEVKALGTAFDGSSLDTTSGWSDAGTSGVAINSTKTGLTTGTRYKWRTRLKYRLSDGAPQPYSRWIYPPLNAPTETDFRTN